MKRIMNILAILVVVLFLSGCCTRSMVVLIPEPDGKVGQLLVSNEGGQQILNQANQSVKVTDRKTAPGKVATLSAEEIQSTFSDALAVQPLRPVTFILYFLQDSNELTDESKAVLPKIFQTVRERGSTDIVISGHTDRVGEKEYNYKLALDRARVTSDILVASGSVRAHISVTSHGEGNPLIKTADEIAEPKNRRVEVVIK